MTLGIKKAKINGITGLKHALANELISNSLPVLSNS